MFGQTSDGGHLMCITVELREASKKLSKNKFEKKTQNFGS